jgi:hypothetical protein
MATKKYYVTVDEEGTIRWYNDAKRTVFHRVGGPAVEYTNGTKVWLQNGNRHRDNGPAFEFANGEKRWYLNGVQLTEAEFLAATQPTVEMTVADIEKLVGKRVKIVK